MISVRPDRVYLTYNEAECAWDLIERDGDRSKEEPKDLILARFFTGQRYEPGFLARWAQEEVKIAQKA